MGERPQGKWQTGAKQLLTTTAHRATLH